MRVHSSSCSNTRDELERRSTEITALVPMVLLIGALSNP